MCNYINCRYHSIYIDVSGLNSLIQRKKDSDSKTPKETQKYETGRSSKQEGPESRRHRRGRCTHRRDSPRVRPSLGHEARAGTPQPRRHGKGGPRHTVVAPVGVSSGARCLSRGRPDAPFPTGQETAVLARVEWAEGSSSSGCGGQDRSLRSHVTQVSLLSPPAAAGPRGPSYAPTGCGL